MFRKNAQKLAKILWPMIVVPLPIAIYSQLTFAAESVPNLFGEILFERYPQIFRLLIGHLDSKPVRKTFFYKSLKII